MSSISSFKNKGIDEFYTDSNNLSFWLPYGIQVEQFLYLKFWKYFFMNFVTLMIFRI